MRKLSDWQLSTKGPLIPPGVLGSNPTALKNLGGMYSTEGIFLSVD